MIDGELIAQLRENNEEKSQIVGAGGLIETEHSAYTFSNDSDEIVRFLFMKRLPSITLVVQIRKIVFILL